MATNFIIPKTQEQAQNTSRLIIRNFGLQNVKTVAYNIPQSEKDQELYKSQLGTPVFSNFETSGGTYTDKGRTYTYPALKLDTVLFDITQVKNIVITPINGGEDVVEYVSNKNKAITIYGVLSGGNNQFPLQGLKDFKQAMIDAPVPIQVSSWYLSTLDIFSIVVTEVNIRQEEGRYSEQPFVIQAISVKPVELKLK